MSTIVNILSVLAPPGTGKSTLIDKMLVHLPKQKLHVVHEYEDHMKEHLLQRKFVLQPSDYQKICPEIALSIAEEIGMVARNGKNLIIFEAARDVGQPVVGYAEGLISPLTESLKERGFDPRIFALEVFGGNKDQLWERLDLRRQIDPTAAPPEVLENYVFGLEGMPWTIGEKLAASGLVNGFNVVDNANGFKRLETEVIRVLPEVESRLMINTEGRRPGFTR